MYIVIEIQTNSDGTVGNFVWAFNSEQEALSKYHSVLSFAAVSQLPKHSCVVITNEGYVISSYCFTHEQE